MKIYKDYKMLSYSSTNTLLSMTGNIYKWENTDKNTRRGTMGN